MQGSPTFRRIYEIRRLGETLRAPNSNRAEQAISEDRFPHHRGSWLGPARLGHRPMNLGRRSREMRRPLGRSENSPRRLAGTSRETASDSNSPLDTVRGSSRCRAAVCSNSNHSYGRSNGSKRTAGVLGNKDRSRHVTNCRGKRVFPVDRAAVRPLQKLGRPPPEIVQDRLTTRAKAMVRAS
jgi:hypothetical protein